MKRPESQRLYQNKNRAHPKKKDGKNVERTKDYIQFWYQTGSSSLILVNRTTMSISPRSPSI